MKEVSQTACQLDDLLVDNLLDMNEKIQKIKALTLSLESGAGQFPGIRKNAKRALASIKMMELNLSDLVSFGLISENPGECPKKT